MKILRETVRMSGGRHLALCTAVSLGDVRNSSL